MFYCEKLVKKGRKEKTCRRCGKTIVRGESSYSIPSECFEFTIDLCMDCHKHCEDGGINSVSEIPSIEDEELELALDSLVNESLLE